MPRMSRRAEQQKESQESVVVPQAGVLYPKPSAKGLAKALMLFVPLGALAVFPFGLISFGGLPVASRLFMAALIGAVAGGVVGLIVGPSVGARDDAKKHATGKAEVAEATGQPER